MILEVVGSRLDGDSTRLFSADSATGSLDSGDNEDLLCAAFANTSSSCIEYAREAGYFAEHRVVLCYIPKSLFLRPYHLVLVQDA